MRGIKCLIKLELLLQILLFKMLELYNHPTNCLYLPIYSRLRRKRNKCRQEIRAQKKDFLNRSMAYILMIDKMLCLQYLVFTIGENCKTFTKTTLEHYIMVGEPEGFYLDHFSPPNGKG